MPRGLRVDDESVDDLRVFDSVLLGAETDMMCALELRQGKREAEIWSAAPDHLIPRQAMLSFGFRWRPE